MKWTLKAKMGSPAIGTRIFDLGRMPDRAAEVYRELIDIMVAIEIGDPQAASAVMVRHIDNVKASIIRHLSTI